MKPPFLAVALALGALFPMKTFAVTPNNNPVPYIDPARFAGKWYSLYSIPTFLDRRWRETVENYTPRAEGGFDVYTTYRKVGDSKIRHIRSVLFPVKGKPGGELRAQFFWPIKVPYRIVELAPDYSCMVGGSPDRKMLFILSRTPAMPEAALAATIKRCRERGYDVEKLTSQEHAPKPTR